MRTLGAVSLATLLVGGACLTPIHGQPLPSIAITTADIDAFVHIVEANITAGAAGPTNKTTTTAQPRMHAGLEAPRGRAPRLRRRLVQGRHLRGQRVLTR